MTTHSLVTDWPLLAVYCILMPLCLGIAAVVAGLIVWKLNITNYKNSMLVGIGAVPLIMGGILYSILWNAHTLGFVLYFRFMWAGVGGSVLGGWVGAVVLCLTNQRKSDRPDMQQAYQETLAILADKNSPPPFWSASNALWKIGLSDTPSNVFLWRLGWVMCSLWTLTFLFWMAAGGLLEPERLAQLPSHLRLLGGLAPLAAPVLLWGLTCRWWPALGFALRDGIMITSVPLTLLYVLLNVMATLHV